MRFLVSLLFALALITGTARAQFGDFGGPSAYGPGDTVVVQVTVALPGSESFYDVPIAAVACEGCLLGEGAGPHLKLAVQNGLVVVHRDGIGYPTVPASTAVQFPRNVWVDVTWTIELSEGPARSFVVIDTVAGAPTLAFSGTFETLPSLTTLAGAGLRPLLMGYNVALAAMPVETGPQPVKRGEPEIFSW